MTEGFWGMGRMAARSARLLLDAKDAHGAVNRAYFAMFHTARAALAHADPELSRTKRHATVISRFGRHMVKERGLNPMLGRAFSLAFDMRTIADYEPVAVDPREAEELIETAEGFLAALTAYAEEKSE